MNHTSLKTIKKIVKGLKLKKYKGPYKYTDDESTVGQIPTTCPEKMLKLADELNDGSTIGAINMKKLTSKIPKKTTISFTPAQLNVIEKSLEVYSRMRQGQFNTAIGDAFNDHIIGWNERELIHHVIRATLKDKKGELIFPEQLNMSYGVGQKEFADGQLAYEVAQVIKQYKAVKENDGYFDSGLNGRYHSPCHYSGEPLPIIEDFNLYLDFPITKEMYPTFDKFYDGKKWEQMWKYIDENMKLPSCEKKEIIYNSKTITLFAIRCHRPQRQKEI